LTRTCEKTTQSVYVLSAIVSSTPIHYIFTTSEARVLDRFHPEVIRLQARLSDEIPGRRGAEPILSLVPFKKTKK